MDINSIEIENKKAFTFIEDSVRKVAEISKHREFWKGFPMFFNKNHNFKKRLLFFSLLSKITQL